MAREFNGTSSRIIMTKGSSATDLQVMTYAFWAKQDTFSGYDDLFWSGGSWSSNYHTFVQHDTAVYMKFTANWSTSEAQWSISNPNTEWHHHIITYDFGSTTNDPIWYLDNVSQTITERVSPSGTAGYASDDGTMTFGAYDDGSAEYYDGKLAEFALFNRIITSDERANLAAGASPIEYLDNGLVMYVPFKDNNISDIISGNNGADTGSTNFTHPTITYPSQSNPRTLVQGGI